MRYPENSKLLLLFYDPNTKDGAFIQTVCDTVRVMGGGGHNWGKASNDNVCTFM